MTADGDDQSLLDFDRAAAAVAALLAGAGGEDWQRPTPCTDWDVRAVVSHLVNGNLILTAPVTGATAPDWSDDNLGDDPAGAFLTSSAGFRAALARPGALTASYDSVLGHESGAALVRMRVSELVVHGWDLARGLGRAADEMPDLAEQVLAFWRAALGDAPREGMPFDAAKPTGADASATDRLAAYLGRS